MEISNIFDKAYIFDKQDSLVTFISFKLFDGGSKTSPKGDL